MRDCVTKFSKISILCEFYSLLKKHFENFCIKIFLRFLLKILIFFGVGSVQFREGVSYQVWVYKTISNYYSEYLAVIDMKHVSSGKEQTLTSAFRAKRRFLSLMMQEKFYFLIHMKNLIFIHFSFTSGLLLLNRDKMSEEALIESGSKRPFSQN